MDKEEKDKIVETIAKEAQAEVREKIDRWERYCDMVFASCIGLAALLFVFFYFYRDLFDSYKTLIVFLLSTLTFIHFLLLYRALKILEMHRQFDLAHIQKFSILNRLWDFKTEVNQENIDECKKLSNDLGQLTYRAAVLHDRMERIYAYEKNGIRNERIE